MSQGLRTLVYAKRSLTEEQYSAFNTRFTAARASIMQRDARVAAVIASLERDLQLIAVTGTCRFCNPSPSLLAAAVALSAPSSSL